MADWSLWSTDYFDRETPPACDARGDGLQAGLAALWTRTLDEGIQDDGKATFTWFQLRTATGHVSLPRDPFSNPALAKLRRWRAEPGLVEWLAGLHAQRPHDTGAQELLDVVEASSDVADLRRRLASR